MTWGEWPRQRSGMQTGGSSLTLEEQFQMREEARGRLDAAEASMYEPRDYRAPSAVRRLAYEDRAIDREFHAIACRGLKRLVGHFDRLDKPRILR